MTWTPSEEQRLCIEDDAGALCIVAPAGSGKTAVLAHRIARRIRSGETKASHVLAISFTRASSFGLKIRTESLLDGESITVGTFHAIALDALERYWTMTSIRPLRILSSPQTLLRKMSQPRSNSRPTNVAAPRSTPRRAWEDEVAGEISWAKAMLIEPQDYVHHASLHQRKTTAPPGEIADAYHSYEERKQQERLIDLDDLVTESTKALTTHRGFADSERYIYRHLYVDEFQDLNASQFAFLVALMGNRRDLTVVGDPNQAIYGWNGSDPRFMLYLGEVLPTLKVLKLTTNFRSTPEIVSSATSVLPKIDKEEFSQTTKSSRHSSPTSSPRLLVHKSDRDEITHTMREIRRLHHLGLPYRSMAILARTGAILRPFAQELTANSIPHGAPGKPALLQREGVLEFLDHLRSELGDAPISNAVDEIDQRINEFEAGSENLTPTIDYDALTLIKASMVAHLRNGVSHLHEYLTLLSDGDNDDLVSRAGTVTLTTFHRAKGLEWHHVHIVGAEDGLIPHYQARTVAQIEEEQRLLYVAMTRATDSLTISCAKVRRFGAKALERQPSPLLFSTQRGEAPKIRRLPLRPAELKAAIAPRSDHQGVNSHLLDQLLQWRNRAASQIFTNPTTIASDRLLRAVAREIPRSEVELMALDSERRLRSHRHRRDILALCVAHSSSINPEL